MHAYIHSRFLQHTYDLITTEGKESTCQDSIDITDIFGITKNYHKRINIQKKKINESIIHSLLSYNHQNIQVLQQNKVQIALALDFPLDLDFSFFLSPSIFVFKTFA